MQIRWTQPGDASGFNEAVARAGLSPTPAQISFYLDSPVVGTFVALEDGRIVGTGCCTAYLGGTGWIGLISVLPEFRGRGLGTALTKWGIEALRDQGVQSFVLTATADGRPLYERLGFSGDSDYLVMKGTGLGHPPRAEQAKRIAGEFVGALAGQATSVKAEHMMMSENGRPQPTWVVTFDGVARPPAGPAGQKAPPLGTKAYQQTTVFVDSGTGEIWRAVEQSYADVVSTGSAERVNHAR